MEFSKDDLLQIEQQGTSVSRIKAQLKQFHQGVPFMTLDRACTIGDGILQVADSDQTQLVQQFEPARRAGRAGKFVPSSGAASRMFKSLHSAKEKLRASQPVTDPAFIEFTKHLDQFAFAGELAGRLTRNNLSLSQLRQKAQFLPILQELLDTDRMNYGNLPKGLLPFHQYPEGPRTPVEEHLAEAAALTQSDAGQMQIHFTISPEHEPLFRSLINTVRPRLETGGRNLGVTFSCQKSGTDTLAVTPANKPFRREDGRLLFRPGGHGALIDNLNDLKGDILFIKNIDNVVPDRLKPETITCKKVLAGLLLQIQDQTFAHLNWLQCHSLTEAKRSEIVAFIAASLGTHLPPEFIRLPLEPAQHRLMQLLNRPLRVCGMVKNQGEPGGGPFWVKSPDGSQHLQIVELSQINQADLTQREIARSATHFNPVDLVCAVRNHQGKPFHLPDFVNPDAGFISEKSEAGKPLKALELPGLWNGAMAHWNTLFVEVPLITFNPVKTINDLLRPQHQPS